LLSPAAQVSLPGERLYKARWMPQRPDSKTDQRSASESTKKPSGPPK